MNDTVLGFPINRFVTFVQPALNAGAGLVAAWLVAKVQILGVLGVGQDQLTTQIAALASALIVTGALELGRSQWIRGHHIQLANGGIQVVSAPRDQGDVGGAVGEGLGVDG